MTSQTQKAEALPSILESIIEFDSRRLTGLNFYADQPLVIIELQLPAPGKSLVLAQWQHEVESLHRRFGLTQPEIMATRNHDKGECLYFSAAIDRLYPAIEINELALFRALTTSVPLDKKISEELYLEQISELLRTEANPNLLTLQETANQQHLPFLWDDDLVSLGFGQSSQSWSPTEIPATVDTSDIKTIPISIITGTNGKSTTTRLCSSILTTAGLTTGFSSTDGVWAGSQCLDTGDYSGPGGARMVLRNPQVEAAILEVARGGLLRRGLGVNQADVALITNVAEDHLGEYGVNTLEELIRAKFIVAKAVRACGTLILNADDSGSVTFSRTLDQTIVWFSQDKQNPQLVSSLENGGNIFYIEQDHIVAENKDQRTVICNVLDVPITLKGAAKYNVSNVLSAVALCTTLGIDNEHIHQGLISFVPTPENNPGRGNFFEINQRQIMMDFAHNAHGVRAVVDTVAKLPARRRLIMLGCAGDREDLAIEALAVAAATLAPDAIVVYELEAYLRGRTPGEVSQIIINKLNQLELNTTVLTADSPSQGTEKALSWSEPEDALLLLVLGERDEVLAKIKAFS